MLADAGADVVGLNCIRGPRTMLPLIARIVRAVDVPVAALPVPYRTHSRQPTFQSLRDRHCDCIPGDMPFPVALDPFTCNRFEIAEFAKAAVRSRRALHRPVLRGDAASHPQHRRGARPQAAGEPLLGRHVEARVLRHQCAAEEDESRVRAEALRQRSRSLSASSPISASTGSPAACSVSCRRLHVRRGPSSRRRTRRAPRTDPGRRTRDRGRSP